MSTIDEILDILPRLKAGLLGLSGEAFPRFEWKQYGNFLVVRAEGWILSVDVAFPEHGYSASFTEIDCNLLRLPPAASYKTCTIAAVKDVLEQTQQSIRLKVNQLNKLSEELK